MTPTQKNFRKQMKELERENVIPDSYRARHKRPTYSKKINYFAIIILLWNSFAIYTWVVPFFRNKDTNKFNNSITTKETVRYSIGSNSEYKKVSTYLQKTAKVESEIGKIINKINNNSLGNIYSKEEITSDIGKVEGLGKEIRTEDINFKNLEYVYSDIIFLTKSMLINSYYDLPIYNGLENGNEKWANAIESKHNIVIDILKKYNINYKVYENGTIEYGDV